MSRDLPVELADAVEQPVVKPFLAIFIDLPDPVYAFTGIGELEFADSNGDLQTWIGAGRLGAIDAVSEATDGSATGIKATLFDVPSEHADDIADQATRGAKMEVYVGAIELGDDWHSVLATKLLWRGRVDEYKITDAGTSLTVEISGESRAIDQCRPSIKRFTDEYQQRKHSGDLFFQYVSKMSEVSILWAKAEPSGSTVGGGTGGLGGFIMRQANE